MKKVFGIIISVVFLVLSSSVCFATRTPFSWVNIGPSSINEVAHAESTDDEKIIETRCEVALKKNKIIDIIVTIEIFDEYSGLRDGVIDYHAYIEKGKLIEDPLTFTEILESGFGIKEVNHTIDDNYDDLKKECINDMENLSQGVLKKINQAFKNKNKYSY
jgi:hypothetical protein